MPTKLCHRAMGLLVPWLLTALPAVAGSHRLVVTDAPADKVAGGAIEARILIDREQVTDVALTELRIKDGAVLSPHVHPEATEIIYMKEGEGDVVLSGKVERVRAGDAIAIPAGVVHGFTAGKSPVVGIQFYVPGGPEQRFRGAAPAGTVKPEESAARDPGSSRIVTMAAAKMQRLDDGTVYRSYIEGLETPGRAVDLLHVTIPASHPADPHPHDDVWEVTYVLRGGGTVRIDDGKWPVRAGTGYYTPQGSKMGLATDSETEILVLVGFAPKSSTP